MKHLFKSTFAILALTAAACTGRGDKAQQQQAQTEPEPPKTEYGIVVDDYRTEQGRRCRRPDRRQHTLLLRHIGRKRSTVWTRLPPRYFL